MVFCGLRILAVSAMNLTPQKAMTSASVSAALRDSSRLSPTEIGEVLNLGLLVIMRQNDRVAILAEAFDFSAQVEAREISAHGSSHGFFILIWPCLGQPPTRGPAAGQFAPRLRGGGGGKVRNELDQFDQALSRYPAVRAA